MPVTPTYGRLIRRQWNGKIYREPSNGKIVRASPEGYAAFVRCCCLYPPPPPLGCCVNTLFPGDELNLDVIGVTGNLANVYQVNDGWVLQDPFFTSIWTIAGDSSNSVSNGPNDNWMGFSLACVNDNLSLEWDNNSTGECPLTPSLFTVLTGQCDPFRFEFTVTQPADVGDPCIHVGGTLTLRVTKI